MTANNPPDDYLSISTPENVAFGYDVAGIGSRFLAAVVDTLIILVLQVVVNLTLLALVLSLFRDRLLSVNLFAGWASFAAIGGVFVLLPFYLENVLGHSPAETGLLLASAPLALGLAAPAAGSISDRIGPWPVILVGLSVLLGSYLLMMTLDVRTTALGYLLVMAPVGLGMGIFQSPNNSAIMGAVPQRRLGVTSGLLTITRITGQLSGISVLGAVWAARVAAHAGVRGEPSGAPAVAQVAGLRETMVVSALLVGISLALAAWARLADGKGASHP